MKLNKFDQRMLKWAQGRILARGHGYICGELYRFPTEAPDLTWYEALYAHYRSWLMRRSINAVLKNRTFDGWFMVHGPSERVALDYQLWVHVQGRCAWIDRMIDTGEIR